MLSPGKVSSTLGCSLCLYGQEEVSLIRRLSTKKEGRVGCRALRAVVGGRTIPLPAKGPVRGFELEFSWTKLWGAMAS